ncbi:MAG: hypothetical protein KGJ89_02635 [Patescibacteria group bacterium]|nr:hypothetical protein [Patescibacteria group bacterium]MDE2015775.1 hypothetical protein [Patescibacteria group bacterium]MDE2226832.1 hypothetical protein [Patescibacteria group bacterium]
MNKKIQIVISVAVVVFIGGYMIFVNKNANTNTFAHVAGEGERCGGNMTTAPVCASGFHCAPEPGSHLPFGDVGGTCVKDSNVQYVNSQYGFSIPLADSWKGYSILEKNWDGWSTDGAGDNTPTTHGPLIILRHPDWTDSTPREDMPIMVFTPDEWNLVFQEKLAVSAAPIPPSVLGQNSKYVLALPARYNYDSRIGWEEVDNLVHGLTAFEPTQ